MLDLSTATATLRTGYAYWQAKCAGRPMPVRADLQPPEMLPFLGHILLLDVLNGPRDFRYRLIGTAVDSHMNGRYTGLLASSLPHQREGNQMWRNFCHVADTGQPVFSHVSYVGKHKDFMAAQDLIMPLGTGGMASGAMGTAEAGVAMLFVVVDFALKSPSRRLFD
ncbi:PAS domain-containing protein [Ferrovibrio sp.]|uniref:PAS domain-containing protein n=1 Tax=Ferrovibrio sp. TaxID=1917215 RepID=UPI003D11B3C1